MELAAFVSQLRVGPTTAVGPLRLVALLGPEQGPDAEFLEEALASTHATVSEVSESGVVGRVRIEHRGDAPLLLLDGEQIVGAKQNRIVNASFLVAPGQAVDIPVSCVERGRWSYRSTALDSSETTLTAFARSSKLRRVVSSLDDGRGYDSDQDATWRDVDSYLERTGTTSTSAAFDDAYVQRRAHADQMLAMINPVPHQVGIAAVRGHEFLCFDVFGSPSLYARGWKKIARGLFAEAYDSEAPASEAEALAAVGAVLDAIGKSHPARTPAPGAGETLHAISSEVTFTGLVSGGALYHALAVGNAA